MKIRWLAALSATALLFTAGIAAAETNQFGPFADDDRYLYDERAPASATFDTKAEVYGDVYGDEYLYEYDDGFVYDEDYGFAEPELWVGVQ